MKNYEFFKLKNNYKRYRQICSINKISSRLPEQPRVSFVIPTYKKIDMFKLALNSVLHQSEEYPYEIVVVNDDPADEALEEYLRQLDNPRISYYINEKNLGLFGNWNRCIELAKGEWIAILNDDDYLYDYYLKEIAQLLERHKEIQYLYVNHDVAKIKSSEHARNIFKQREEYWRNRHYSNRIKDIIKHGPLLSRVTLLDMFMRQAVTHPLGTLIRKDKALELGGYNEDCYPSADWVFNVNYLIQNNIYYYNKVLGCRSEGINVSNSYETRKKFIEMDYSFRRELAKKLKVPFADWYTDCVLYTYAKAIKILRQIDIASIKSITEKDLRIYRFIRRNYIRVYNIYNYIRYN